MQISDAAARRPVDAAARLRDLLAQLDGAAQVSRDDPRAAEQLALCAEVEAILRMRAHARAASVTDHAA
jgi:hypothetical protein